MAVQEEWLKIKSQKAGVLEMAMDVLRFYVTAFGDVMLPMDFPEGVYRKDGRPDMRRKIGPSVARYFEDLDEAACQEYVAGKWPGELKTIGWNEWLAKS